MLFGIVVEVRVERHDEAGELLESMVVPLVRRRPDSCAATGLAPTINRRARRC